MTITAKNLLIVEDNKEWCDGYLRTASREGFNSIKIAQDLSVARQFIDEMQFAVAFIDVALNVTDDRNVDGLRVMAKIRETGDPTSIVVVTGKIRQDVLSITQTIKKYGALDIIRKADIEPQDIRRLLGAGLEAYRQESAAEGLTPVDVLRGVTPAQHWEDQIVRGIPVRDGVAGLKKFLGQLLDEYLPMLPPWSNEPVSVDSETGLAHGAFWSRASGRAVALVFGHESVREESRRSDSSGLLLGRYSVGPLLKNSTAHGLTGAVFELRDSSREVYGATQARTTAKMAQQGR
jgi:ActR/RegA family two-component response regulator